MLFASKIRKLREEQNLLQRQLAAALEIDTPMYGKIERNELRAKKEQIPLIAKMLHADYDELRILWYVDKAMEVIERDKKKFYNVSE